YRQLLDARRKIREGEIKQASQDVKINKLQGELGVLTVADPAKVYVLALPKVEARHWKWRVHWPGGSCSVCFAAGELPPTGLQIEPVNTFSFGQSGQMTVEAILHRNSDGQQVFTVLVPHKHLIYNHPLTEEQADAICARVELAGGAGTTETFSRP